MALPGAPLSDEFMTAYQAALAGSSVPAPNALKLRDDRGTFGWLVQQYFESSDFARLKSQTQRTYRSIIENVVLAGNIGHRPVSQMTREHVSRILAKRKKWSATREQPTRSASLRPRSISL